MTQGESSTVLAFEAAQTQIANALTIAIAEAANSLLNLMRTAATYRQRGQFASTQTQLLQNRTKFLAAFKEALKEKVALELDPKASEHANEATDWEAVSLVDEDSIEERLSFERVGQLINHQCEAELRELTSYTSTILRHGWADPERNPLRGNVVGYALHQAVESAIEESEIQRILMREIGQPLAKALCACYRSIVEDFEKRGFTPSEVAPRPAHPAGMPAAPAMPGAPPTPTFEEARALWERSMEGRLPPEAGDTLRSWESSILGRYGRIDPIPEDFDPEGSAALLDRLIRGGMPGSLGGGMPGAFGGGMPGTFGGGPPGMSGLPGAPGMPGLPGPAPAGRSPASAQADAELMHLLRRLNGGNSGPGRLDTDSDAGRRPLSPDGRDGAPAARYGYPAGSQPPSGGGSGGSAGGVRALMAANLIRAHRDELQQASRGKLDHMVIEVVASLFDQILSDSRVAPQMARQIARLQLPVLRVALKDPNFFSSRRHPVRRFINRVTTLAAGFGAFESGPAKEFLARVTNLVNDIVEGDFDQLDTYNEKLAELESFVEEQARAEVEATPAAETLKVKELEWKQQQQFSAHLLSALEALAMPAYLKEFISKVWGRVILAVSQRDGDESANAQRFRKAAFDLVVSIQPKRSVEQRSRFLSTLPGLMATLNEGMKLIDWPEQENTAFFGKLLAEHAGSLKTAPASELDYNLLLRGVEAAAKTPLPSKEEAAATTLEAGPGAVAIEPQFSPEEAKNLGLIADSAVDWQARIAITPEDVVERAFDTPLPTVLAGEAGDAAADEDRLPAPTEGPQLRDHLELGTSYQLHLKDRWEKVRLTYMSPGRTMFLFKHGSEDRGTISMTSRMLQRLCESRRMRAFERATLVDRATERARQQLSQLDANPDERLAG